MKNNYLSASSVAEWNMNKFILNLFLPILKLYVYLEKGVFIIYLLHISLDNVMTINHTF